MTTQTQNAINSYIRKTYGGSTVSDALQKARKQTGLTNSQIRSEAVKALAIQNKISEEKAQKELERQQKIGERAARSFAEQKAELETGKDVAVGKKAILVSQNESVLNKQREQNRVNEIVAASQSSSNVPLPVTPVLYDASGRKLSPWESNVVSQSPMTSAATGETVYVSSVQQPIADNVPVPSVVSQNKRSAVDTFRDIKKDLFVGEITAEDPAKRLLSAVAGRAVESAELAVEARVEQSKPFLFLEALAKGDVDFNLFNQPNLYDVPVFGGTENVQQSVASTALVRPERTGVIIAENVALAAAIPDLASGELLAESSSNTIFQTLKKATGTEDFFANLQAKKLQKKLSGKELITQETAVDIFKGVEKGLSVEITSKPVSEVRVVEVTTPAREGFIKDSETKILFGSGNVDVISSDDLVNRDLLEKLTTYDAFNLKYDRLDLTKLRGSVGRSGETAVSVGGKTEGFVGLESSGEGFIPKKDFFKIFAPGRKPSTYEKTSLPATFVPETEVTLFKAKVSQARSPFYFEFEAGGQKAIPENFEKLYGSQIGGYEVKQIEDINRFFLEVKDVDRGVSSFAFSQGTGKPVTVIEEFRVFVPSKSDGGSGVVSGSKVLSNDLFFEFEAASASQEFVLNEQKVIPDSSEFSTESLSSSGNLKSPKGFYSYSTQTPSKEPVTIFGKKINDVKNEVKDFFTIIPSVGAEGVSVQEPSVGIESNVSSEEFFVSVQEPSVSVEDVVKSSSSKVQDSELLSVDVVDIESVGSTESLSSSMVVAESSVFDLQTEQVSRQDVFVPRTFKTSSFSSVDADIGSPVFPIPIPTGKDKDKKKKKNDEDLFEAIAKVRGEFKTVGFGRSKQEAKFKAINFVKSNPAATAAVRKDGIFQNISAPKGFYKKGSTVIEKKSQRINTLGELSGITFKGIQASRRKRK